MARFWDECDDCAVWWLSASESGSSSMGSAGAAALCLGSSWSEESWGALKVFLVLVRDGGSGNWVGSGTGGGGGM